MTIAEIVRAVEAKNDTAEDFWTVLNFLPR